MKARVPLITLGVDDLERAVRFYRDGLGEHGAVAFFELEGGLKLALWPRKSLAHDAGIALGRAKLERVSPLHTTLAPRRKRQGRKGHLLRRLCRLLRGSRRPSVGGGVESALAMTSGLPMMGRHALPPPACLARPLRRSAGLCAIRAARRAQDRGGESVLLGGRQVDIRRDARRAREVRADVR